MTLEGKTRIATRYRDQVLGAGPSTMSGRTARPTSAAPEPGWGRVGARTDSWNRIYISYRCGPPEVTHEVTETASSDSDTEKQHKKERRDFFF